MQHRIPIGTLEAHDELVTGDTGVVHEDVDLAELRNNVFERRFDLILFLYIGRAHICTGRDVAASTAKGCNLLRHLFQPLLISCDEYHVSATSRQLQSTCPSNSL